MATFGTSETSKFVKARTNTETCCVKNTAEGKLINANKNAKRKKKIVSYTG
jgi:hypothetical protein